MMYAPAYATTCPSCHQPPGIDRRFCQFCGHFLAAGRQDLKYAGFGRRLAAYFVDGLTAFFLPILSAILFGALSSSIAGALLGFLVGIVAAVAIQLSFWTQGTSLGKSMLGAYVFKTSGERATFGTMFLREFIGKSLLGWLLGVFDVLWALIDKDYQSLHDKFAGTVVVYDRDPSRDRAGSTRAERSRTAVACPNCQRTVGAGWQFCAYCLTPLSSRAARGASRARY